MDSNRSHCMSDAAKNAAIASLFLIFVYTFQKVNVWEMYFASPGPEYVAYNLLRFFSLPLIFFVTLSVGRLVVSLPVLSKDSFLERVGVSCMFMAGLCAVGVFTYVCLLCGNFNMYVSVCSCFATLLFSGIQTARLLACKILSLCFRFRSYKAGGKLLCALAWVVLLWQLASVFMNAVIDVRLVNNDEIGGYVPFFQDVIIRGGLLPTAWVHVLFLAKGAVNHLFHVSYLEVNAIKAVNYLLLLMLLRMLYDIYYMVSRSNPVSLLACSLVLTFALANQGYLNLHIANSFYIISIFWGSLMVFFKKRTVAYPVVLLFSAISPLFSGIVVFFSAPMLAFFSLCSLFSKHNARWRFYLLFIANVVGVVVVYLSNYFQIGAVDISIAMFDRFIDAPKWGLLTNQQFVVGSPSLFGNAVLPIFAVFVDGVKLFYSDISLYGNIYGAVFAFSVVAYVFLYVYGKEKSKTDRRNFSVFILSSPLIILSILCYALVVNDQRSGPAVYRITLYRSAVVVMLLLILSRFISVRCLYILSLKHRSFSAIFQSAVIGLLLYFSTSLPPSSDINLSRRMKPFSVSESSLEFLKGGLSYAQAIHRSYPVVEYVELIKAVPFIDRVIPLNFDVAAYSIPGTPFLRISEGEVQTRPYSSDIYLGTPDAAWKAYSSIGYHNFSIILKEGHPLSWHAFTPIFYPQNILEYFEISYCNGQGVYLLRLKNTTVPGEGVQFLCDKDLFVEEYEAAFNQLGNDYHKKVMKYPIK